MTAWIEGFLAAIIRRPVLAQRGDVILVTFGPISGAVTLAGFFFGLMSLQAFGLPPALVSRWAICAPLSMLAGSFLLPKALNLLKSPRCFLENVGSISFTFLGGFVGVVMVNFYLARLFNVSILTFSDAACLGIPLFHGLSRLACLNYGCCYGKPIQSRRFPGVIYRNKACKAVRMSGLSGVRLHPVQLYELLANLVIQLAIFTFLQAPRGTVAGIYLVLYGIARMFLRKFRFKMPFHRDPLPHYETMVTVFFLFTGCVFCFLAAINGLPSEFSPGRVRIRELLSLVPMIGAMSLTVTAAYGLHFKKVGQWF
jgi:hypothetical protein